MYWDSILGATQLAAFDLYISTTITSVVIPSTSFCTFTLQLLTRCEVVYRKQCIVVYSIAIVVFSARFRRDHFLILIKLVTQNPLVHQMTTHLNYPHTNLGHVTLAELVKHRFGSQRETHSWISETHLFMSKNVTIKMPVMYLFI